jgi:hypothetical protein
LSLPEYGLYRYPHLSEGACLIATPDNPFSPNFGAEPLFLAGRADVLDAVQRVSLNLARRDYSRATIIVGQRGTGKTVLLNQTEELAEQQGWVVVRCTASRGFLQRLVSTQLPNLLAELRPGRPITTSATLGGGPVPGSITVTSAPGHPVARGFVEYVAEICDALGPRRGLLFAVDEVNSASRAELESFAGGYQQLVGREGRNVALVMCGAHSALRRMLAGPSAMSFLARAQQIAIGILTYPVTIEAFRRTIQARGTKTAAQPVLELMAAISKGYPYLIQEVGYLAWDHRPAGDEPGGDEITLDDVRAIAPRALAAMRDAVLGVILRDVRGRYRAALTLIAQHPEIRTAELAARLSIPTTSVGDIHLRLIDGGLLARTAERGVVRITIPYLADFLATDDSALARGDDEQVRALDSFPEV